MTKPQFLLDSNAIYKLVRETPEKALEKILEGTTISLAYYEIGNALWRESRLLKRITIEEAEKSLSLMYAMLARMPIAAIDNGNEILETAYKFNLTFYDSAYLVEAKKNKSTLVSDDKKLAKVAENLGVEILSSNAFANS
jgi:predicted nucleic acid-binding protein